MRAFEGYRKGVNLGGWLSQCVAHTEEHYRQFITEEDIARIAGWGLDHVRLPIDCDVVFSGPDGTAGDRMKCVDDCMAWCEKHRLNVVLDLHKTYGFMFDTQVVSDPSVFFTDAGLQQTFIGLWETLARRYGALHDRVAFELLNEVTDPAFTEAWNCIADRAIAAIRKIAPDTFILVGGVHNNSVTSVPLLHPPVDDKIVYDFHCYEPLIFTHQKAPWVRGMTENMGIAYPDTLGTYRAASAAIGMWFTDDPASPADRMLCADDFDRMFQSAIQYAEKYNAPLYCGEYGVIDRAPAQDAANWFRDIHAVFEKYGIGRACWTYKQRDFGLLDAHYDAVREELIQNL